MIYILVYSFLIGNIYSQCTADAGEDLTINFIHDGDPGGNVTYDGSIVASGGSFGGSEATSNIGNCTSPSPCPVNQTEVVITISTDDYPTETSWFLVDQYGGGWTNLPLTSPNTTYTWNICVPDTHCYSFTMLDSYGDGLCCAWGNGSYNITYDEMGIVK